MKLFRSSYRFSPAMRIWNGFLEKIEWWRIPPAGLCRYFLSAMIWNVVRNSLNYYPTTSHFAGNFPQLRRAMFQASKENTMKIYIGKRFLQLIPILLGITLLSFLLTNMGTADVIDVMES